MSSCPECHRPLGTGNTAGGLCARCLLSLGLAAADAAASGSGPPELLAPRWQILTLLASGRHGTAYLAEQRDPCRQMVVVKLLSPADTVGQAGRRLERALPSLMGLCHPAVNPVLGGGLTSEGVPYLVSAYVPGSSLALLGGRLNAGLGERLGAAVRVADAVAYLHGRHLAHGHLVPTNILLPGRTCALARVADPGVATVAGHPADVSADVAALANLVRLLVPEHAALADAATTAAEIHDRLCQARPPAPPPAAR